MIFHFQPNGNLQALCEKIFDLQSHDLSLWQDYGIPQRVSVA